MSRMPVIAAIGEKSLVRTSLRRLKSSSAE